MKKITLLLTAAIVILSLYSCGKKNHFSGGGAVAPWYTGGEEQIHQYPTPEVPGVLPESPDVYHMHTDTQQIITEIPETGDEQTFIPEVSEAEAETETIAVPTDSEIIAEFETACKIYKSFHGRVFDVSCDYDDSIKADGVTYYKTIIGWTSGINTKDELVAYLRTIFSDEMIDDMIYIENFGGKDKFPYILDTDRGLYTIIGEFAMGDDMEYAGVEKREVIRESDTKLTVRITAKYYPENWLFDDSIPEDEIQYRYIVFDYPMEYADNEWKFMSFRAYN